MALAFTIPSGNSATFTGIPTLPATVSVNIGTASADRIVVVCIGWAAAASAPNGDFATVTINGVSATKVADSFDASTSFGSSIWAALVTSGSGTQNIVFNAVGGNGWLDSGAIMVGVITGDAAATVASSIGSIPPGYPNSHSNVNSAAVTVPAGGIAVLSGVAAHGTASTSSWAGTTSSSPDTEVFDSVQATSTMAHATASATITETVTNADGSGWCAAVFAPSAADKPPYNPWPQMMPILAQ